MIYIIIKENNFSKKSKYKKSPSRRTNTFPTNYYNIVLIIRTLFHFLLFFILSFPILKFIPTLIHMLLHFFIFLGTGPTEIFFFKKTFFFQKLFFLSPPNPISQNLMMLFFYPLFLYRTFLFILFKLLNKRI